MPNDFPKTHAAVSDAQGRVEKLEFDLSKAKASLVVKFAEHAKHFPNQAKLARAMGIGGPYLNDILKGKRGASKNSVTALLGVKFEA